MRNPHAGEPFTTCDEEIAAVADEALARDSAWDGLCWFLERVLERQVADRGLKEVMVLTVSEDQHQAVGRERIGPRVEELVDRAHAEGTLRADAGASDLGVQLLLISSVSTSAEPDLWRRGIGAALIDVAVHEARRQGLSMTVIANPSAREFYEKCGFTVEGEAQTRFGPALRMSR